MTVTLQIAFAHYSQIITVSLKEKRDLHDLHKRYMTVLLAWMNYLITFLSCASGHWDLWFVVQCAQDADDLSHEMS